MRPRSLAKQSEKGTIHLRPAVRLAHHARERVGHRVRVVAHRRAVQIDPHGAHMSEARLQVLLQEFDVRREFRDQVVQTGAPIVVPHRVFDLEENIKSHV